MSEILPPLSSAWLQDQRSGMKQVLEGMVRRDRFDDYSLRQAIGNLHDGFNIWKEGQYIKKADPPKVVFVTATSAIPYAFSIKEAWKTAYKCPAPKFFIIDVSGKRIDLSTVHDNEDLKLLEQQDMARLQRIGNLYDGFDKAALFDEYKLTGSTLNKAENLLEKAGYVDLMVLVGQWGHLNPYTGIRQNMRPIIRATDPSQETGERKLVLNINFHSRRLVSDMKAVGRAMGKEIIRRRVLAEAS